jgi:hypothetical protein
MTATDPRLAPLAAAEGKIRDLLMSAGIRLWGDTVTEHAAAILAALPPDWCGHELLSAELLSAESIIAHNEEVMAEMGALREQVMQQEATIEALTPMQSDSRAVTSDRATCNHIGQAATIATLRATLDGLVEEVPEAELAARFGHGDRYPLDGEVEIEGRIYALRAALATAKEAGG